MHVGEGIVVHFGIFLSGKSVPRGGKYLYGKRSSFIGLDGMDRRDVKNLGGLEME